jgi:hypothetical protein
MLISCLFYSLPLKKESKCSSEKFINFEQTALAYIPEGRTDAPVLSHIIAP